ncbi:hypothetical protein D3C73_1391280 [compost metagenome]
MARPLAVPPVNDTMRTPGCSTRRRPTVDPSPVTTLRMPGGKPASRAMRPSANAGDEVTSEGLRMTALPAASAGATFCASIVSGEFHGVIATTTPYGS